MATEPQSSASAAHKMEKVDISIFTVSTEHRAAILYTLAIIMLTVTAPCHMSRNNNDSVFLTSVASDYGRTGTGSEFR